MHEVLEKTLIRPVAGAVSCELAGETVILEMTSGRYFALDPIGTRVWELLQTVSTPESICGRLIDEYDVDPATCRRDVTALLSEMAENGLITVENVRE